jgi:hypothetical protein
MYDFYDFVDILKKIAGWIILFFLIAIIIGVLAWQPGMAFIAVLKAVGIAFGIILGLGVFVGIAVLAIALISGEI